MGSKGGGIPFLSTIEGEYELNMEMAKATEADARFNAEERKKQATKLMGDQVAAFGMSGVELEGTPMTIIKTDMEEAENEAANIVYGGKLKSWEMKRRAKLGRQGAYESMFKDAGSLALKGG